MINRRKAVQLLGETVRDAGMLVVVFGPLDAYFQAERVSAQIVVLFAAVGLLSIGLGIIFEARMEGKR